MLNTDKQTEMRYNKMCKEVIVTIRQSSQSEAKQPQQQQQNYRKIRMKTQ